MGLFDNETELERNYKNLLRAIRGRSEVLGYGTYQYFLEYVNNIKLGKINNDFFEFDFLNSMVLECINSDSNTRLEDFKEMIKITKFLLPLGEKTEDYEIIKNMIISGNGVVETKLYTLFENKLDYIQLMKLIKDDTLLCENYDYIVNYIIGVSPYCVNQTNLKAEILSFINGLKNELGDIGEYSKKRLEEAKRRCGIYSVDEKTLALIDGEVREINALMEKVNNIRTQVDEYANLVKTLTLKGEEVLSLYAGKKVEEMKENIEMVQSGIISKLDDYLLTLEKELRNDKEKVFDHILKEANEKLRDIKLLVSGLSDTTTSELLRIKKASEDSVEELKRYVENEPQLRKLLKESGDYEAVKEALVKFGGLVGNNNTASTLVSGPSIYIPGNDRVIVSGNPNVILPNRNINYDILPAFDETIPFDVRMNKILEEKKRREDSGEIFHSIVDEVLCDVMEGDWVYLYGPSGCGKSYIIKQVSNLLGIDLVENGKITDKYSVMAYNDPHGRFRATPAFVALVYGSLLSLDEFDNGNPDTQVVLNELYSGLLDTLENPGRKRYVTFAEDMTVPIHPNFRMISAGNTSGEGENIIFSSRGKIDEAVQERMTPKKFDYDNQLEQRIFGENKDWYNFFVNFRKACDKYASKENLASAPGMATTRDAAAIVKYINHNSKSVDQILMEKFIQIKNSSYLNVIIEVMEQIYGISRNDKDINIGQDISLSELSEKDLAKKLVYKCNSITSQGRVRRR